MGTKNFMEAGTEIDALIIKKDQCLVKISNILAEACITRVKNGKTGHLENDIDNLIKSLPETDQVIILRKLAVTLASQIGGNSKPSTNSEKTTNKRSDIFANRF